MIYTPRRRRRRRPPVAIFRPSVSIPPALGGRSSIWTMGAGGRWCFSMCGIHRISKGFQLLVAVAFASFFLQIHKFCCSLLLLWILYGNYLKLYISISYIVFLHSQLEKRGYFFFHPAKPLDQCNGGWGGGGFPASWRTAGVKWIGSSSFGRPPFYLHLYAFFPARSDLIKIIPL